MSGINPLIEQWINHINVSGMHEMEKQETEWLACLTLRGDASRAPQKLGIGSRLAQNGLWPGTKTTPWSRFGTGFGEKN